MFSSLLVATVFAAIAVHADPNPTEPAPGDIYREGSQCPISWEVDTTDTSATWKVMNIELMAGDNYNMQHITTVATVDGTDPSKTTFSFPCPSVTPNSAIYFYQFSSPQSPDKNWTGRFAIADSDGNTTPPANTTQPDGSSIPWGNGNLVDPSQASPAPQIGTDVAVTSSGSSPAPSAPPVSVASSSITLSVAAPASSNGAAPPVMVTAPGSNAPGTGGGSGASRAASSMATVPTSKVAGNTSAITNNTANPNTASGAAAISMDSRLMQAVATLGFVAAAFGLIL